MGTESKAPPSNRNHRYVLSKQNGNSQFGRQPEQKSSPCIRCFWGTRQEHEVGGDLWAGKVLQELCGPAARPAFPASTRGYAVKRSTTTGRQVQHNSYTQRERALNLDKSFHCLLSITWRALLPNQTATIQVSA